MLGRAWKFMFGGSGGDDGDDDKKKKGRKSSPHEDKVEGAIARVEATEDRAKALQKKAAKQRKAAKAYGVMAAQSKIPSQTATLKKKGMAALKRAKMYEGHAAKLGGIGSNLEQMALETESMVASKDAIDGMKDMHGTMIALKEEIDPDAVAEMMGEIDYTMDEFAEISTAISTPIQGTVLMDEVDMENEFDAMMAEEDDRLQEMSEVAALAEMDRMDSTPSVSTTRIPAVAQKTQAAVEKEEEEEENEFEKMTTTV